MQMFMLAFVISGIPERNVTMDLCCSDTAVGTRQGGGSSSQIRHHQILGLGETDRSMATGSKLQPVNVYCDIYKYIFRELIEVIKLKLIW